jgi:hypothetical protein
MTRVWLELLQLCGNTNSNQDHSSQNHRLISKLYLFEQTQYPVVAPELNQEKTQSSAQKEPTSLLSQFIR